MLRSKLRHVVLSALAALENKLPRAGSRKASVSEVKNFLLFEHAEALGTVVHATSLIPALRAAVPDCRIAVVASGFAAEIFRNNTGIDYLIQTPAPLKDFWSSLRSLRVQNPFHGEQFIMITSGGNERAPIALQAFALGATARVGFTEVPEFYRSPLKRDRLKSMIDNNLEIVRALGYTMEHFEPQVFFTPKDLVWARQMLKDKMVRDGQPVVVFVTQTSASRPKGWRSERFQKVAKFLMDRYDAHILFVGTRSEFQAIEEIRADLPASTSNVAGTADIPKMAALLSLCDAGLMLDTGTLHVARAVQLPAVIVAPAWSPPVEWLPVGVPWYRILKNADMAPQPPADYVIDEVEADEVIAALEDLLARFPRKRDAQDASSALPGLIAG